MSDHNDQETIVNNEFNSDLISENITARRKMRSLLFHILYAADAFDYETPAEQIAANFNREYNTGIELDGEIIKTVNEVAKRRNELDEQMIPFLENWKFERIGRCTLLVLRYAIWEILYTTTPHSIVINEAIELAKCFAEQDSYKFVNGILDKIYNSIKPEEAGSDNENLD
ncbi:transcription antitermination factor NusB [Candidatus Babeliales bacterium]|nr:transcription antitermination factor NusB [Candidatus Babeliales bacterium]MBP9843438.1 transcription antitermination factor NusB [Candidatus Babeliales bacterium]